VLELGSGIGACAIAASLMGANVIATDAARTSLKLLRENAEYYNLQRPITVLPLLWGDEYVLSELPPIDILMMSDVIYHNSNRDSLKKTIQYVCGPTTLVLIAHTWRVDPKKDQEFFDSVAYDCGLQMYEVPEELMPQGYNTRGDDGRLPVNIFCFWR
jgi:predicted nicotinamide N-methyase